MAYIKQTVQGSYEITEADRNKAYFLALKGFLVDNGFTVVSEDYETVKKESIVLRFGNTQYNFKILSATHGTTTISLTVYKILEDNTTKVVGSSVSITLPALSASVEDGGTIKIAYAISSTVLLVKNQNSFALVVTSSANSITSSSNVITGNIAYKLIDNTDSDISFINSNNMTLMDKAKGDIVTLSIAHNKLNDDRLIYENKVSVNQNNMFFGDSGEIVGLVGAEKGKIYQTSQGKYFAFANDMAMLMGDEML